MAASLIHWTKQETVDATVRVVRLAKEVADAPEGQRWALNKQLEQEKETLLYHAKSLGCVPILKL